MRMERVTDLDAAVQPQVERRKATTQSIDVGGKLAEKVDDCWHARRQRKPEDE